MALEVKRVFCMDLATAAMVFGILGVIACIYEATETSVAIAFFNETEYALSTNTPEPANDDDYNEDSDSDEKESLVELILTLVGVLIDLLVSALLIVGSMKKLRYMLLPWLVVKGLLLVVLIPGSVLCFLAAVYGVFSEGDYQFFLLSVAILAVTALIGYIWVGVYSLYKRIQNEQNKPIPVAGVRMYPDVHHMPIKS